ncbi:MAG TPA: ATP-binding protein [Brevundimonas sp.]|jgi:signal transduction histidine kinase|uniref:PAS domain-containing sensor histidine kinase n=1 Tax=Brevundimonas sp. TaxID=1871086 RepID=UPI002DE3CFE5|nr:ATP-binding protein [Brevundimonas sp.]
MADADMAYWATAGAAGLALAVGAWAWRFTARSRARLETLTGAVEEEKRKGDLWRAAFTAGGDLRLGPLGAFDGPRLLGSDAVARDLTGGESAEAEAVLSRLRVELGGAIDLLESEGRPFEARVAAGDRAWRVSGHVEAGEAWLAVADAPAVRGGDGAAAGFVAEASPVPTWALDGAGRLVWANRAWLDAVRAASVEEAVRRDVSFDRGADALAMEAARLGQRQEGFRWTAADGRRRAWRIVAEPAPGGASTVYALEVTEAEETRDTLRRHVEAHDETLNHLADAVAIFGPSRRLAFHNVAFQQLFGLDPAWLDERPTHAELLDRLRQRRLLPEVVDYAGWKAAELEFYGAAEAGPDDGWSLPDGRTLRVVRQPHPLGGLLLLFTDITDELKLRSRFNAQLQVQTATLDKLNDAVAVFGSDGRLRLHNEAFESFWKLGGDELRAASDFDAVAELCRRIMPEPGLWLGLKARIADPDPESRVAVSGEAATADGRLAAWQTRPLPDGATLVAFSDVTARRGLERALQDREAALEASQALKREFVGSVSYELRTPLTTIVGYSELLEIAGDLPERARQHAGAIRTAAQQLARSIDDVLDMSQIDAGEMELVHAETSIPVLIEDAAERVRARVEGRGAALVVAVDAGVGAIQADGRRVAQALDHLLENAARAVGEGGQVTLEARSGPEEVRLRVSDTGRGIPYHLQAHVFDRFVRRERGGPGVGLALVKALVELHGGWAEVESEPGKGATFVLHLPRRAAGKVSAPELELRA